MNRPAIVILGAGVNGCALARELLLSGASVTLVDAADAAFGATAYSSRLIHGGLRYLEYGEFDLVRESLGERARLLKLAPHFVHPLELAIPIENIGGGFAAAAGNLVARWLPLPLGGKGRNRGLLLVSAGLALYDAYARDPTLPSHKIEKVTHGGMPVDSRFRWLAVYHDAQIRYPERFTLALLADAHRIASENQTEFRFFNYHRARLANGKITLERSWAEEPAQQSFACSAASASSAASADSGYETSPAALVNATGAWVDRVWKSLGGDPWPRLMGGTKGSHCFTFHSGLREALGGRGVYAEAADGRPIFITPLGDAILIGTTDEPFPDDPATAVAREDEIQYLLEAVNAIFPGLRLRRGDVAFSYCGVRPLPHVDAASPGAIMRRHRIDRRDLGTLPCYSLIGGKLTTCRSLAEEAAERILTDLGEKPRANSRQRPLPGGEDYPADAASLAAARQSLADRHHLPIEAVRAAWDFYGTRCGEILAACLAAPPADDADRELLPGAWLPIGLVRWILRNEWVVALDDSIERRLMLLYDPRLSRRTLARLAELMVESGHLTADAAPRAVEATSQRLSEHFGKHLEE